MIGESERKIEDFSETEECRGDFNYATDAIKSEGSWEEGGRRSLVKGLASR